MSGAGINWQQVGAEALNAAKQVLGSRWAAVAQPAGAQIGALVENAKFIEQNKSAMADLEYKATKINQQRALEGVLSGFEGISILIAEQVAAAVWNVVESALKKLPELAAFIP